MINHRVRSIIIGKDIIGWRTLLLTITYHKRIMRKTVGNSVRQLFFVCAHIGRIVNC